MKKIKMVYYVNDNGVSYIGKTDDFDNVLKKMGDVMCLPCLPADGSVIKTYEELNYWFYYYEKKWNLMHGL